MAPRFAHHVALLETGDEAALADLLAAGLDRFVVQRLGERAVMLDHERLDEVRKLLRRLGQTPRITAE